MQNIFLSYGLTGAIILALGMYILKLEDRHKKERKEWSEKQEKENERDRDIHQRQFTRMNEMSDQSNEVMRENTNILSGLKSLLENQNRR